MMRFSISKLHSINTRRYTAQITELNDYLDIFPGSENFNNMIESYLNNIMIHSMTNGWNKQSYLQVFEFELPFKKSVNMFE